MRFFLISILIFTFSEISAAPIDFYVPSRATTESARLYFSLMKTFKAKHPTIEVNIKNMATYNKLLEAIIKTDNKKWVAVVEISYLLKLKDKNLITSLDTLIEKEGKDKYLSKFLPVLLKNSYGKDNKIYGLPFYRSSPTIYYNLDVLKDSGVDIKNLPLTWDSFEVMLKKVQETKNIPPLCMPPVWDDWIFEAFVIQANSSLMSEDSDKVIVNSPEAILALQYWKKLYDEKLMTKLISSWKGSINLFALGKCPILYYSVGGKKFVEQKANFNWTTNIMPKSKRFGAPIGGTTIFMSNGLNKEEQKDAWQLINFFLEKEVQAEIANLTGYYPVVKDAFEVLRMTRKEKKVIQKQLQYSEPKIMTEKLDKVRVFIKNAIEKTLMNNVPAEESLNEAQKLVDEIM